MCPESGCFDLLHHGLAGSGEGDFFLLMLRSQETHDLRPVTHDLRPVTSAP